MSKKIKDITLLNFLGKGAFGSVYLSKKDGKPGYFATKQIERTMADKPSYYKYFENELKLLQSLHHPNIVHLEDVKKDDKYYYIVMEYVNGGNLSACLKKYKNRFGKAFPEEIVQYLMRQIVDAIKYIHRKNIIHRDLKLDNIMVNFDNENDKNNCNMMKAKIKIIDFGFATQLNPDNNNLAKTVLGSPINMDPAILNVMAKKGKDMKHLGYDQKADIWSLGTICYEMLIGQAVFNAQTMDELVKKVEAGTYSVPTSVSHEMVGFLNGMLQYDGNSRLSADELSVHPFLTKDVRNFKKIKTKKVEKKINNNGLNINVKDNKTIWGIFSEEDEKKLISIHPKNIEPPLQVKPLPEIEQDFNKKGKTDKNIPRINNHLYIDKNYNKSNSNNYPYQGQNQYINDQRIPSNQKIQPKQNIPYNQGQYLGYQYSGMPLFSPFQPPSAQYSGIAGYPPLFGIPTFNPSPSTFNRVNVQSNPQGYTSNYMGPPPPQSRVYGYSQQSQPLVEDLCSIQ